MNTPIYARDLKKENQKDSFMGKGFEKALKDAEEKEEDLVVGYFVDSWKTEK